MASFIATIAAPALTLGLILAVGCSREPDAYAPSVRREPFSATPAKSHVVNMNDPYAETYIFKDISKVLEAGSWRWAGKRPELRIYLDDVRGLKFTADFAVPQAVLSHTGPVTISFFVNGNLLDKVRCDTAGDRHFEKPVPEAWLRPRWVANVVMAPDKTWVGDYGVVHGFVLTRVGFAAM